jgi:hypothetical protein
MTNAVENKMKDLVSFGNSVRLRPFATPFNVYVRGPHDYLSTRDFQTLMFPLPGRSSLVAYSRARSGRMVVRNRSKVGGRSRNPFLGCIHL